MQEKVTQNFWSNFSYFDSKQACYLPDVIYDMGKMWKNFRPNIIPQFILLFNLPFLNYLCTLPGFQTVQSRKAVFIKCFMLNVTREALKLTRKFSGRLKSKIGCIIAKFFWKHWRWWPLRKWPIRWSLSFLKSRAFGVCQTAQAKTLKNIRRSLKRSYSCVQQIIFQKLHNLQGCKTTLWSSSFCGRTMLQNNISMAKLLCSKNSQEFDD